MANDVTQLPENFDPYDMRLKVKFHEKADQKNVIAIVRNSPTLCCGAITGSKFCKNSAGAGTDHLGYGRCRIHGGRSTGPKTEEGKRRANQNNIKHGLYMKTLLPGEEEIFNQLSNDEDSPKSLTHEINILKTKIIAYLTRQADKFKENVEQYGEDVAYSKSKVWRSEGEGVRNYYHAGTIEDPALDRALRTLRSLVETHNRLSGDEGTDDVVTVINKELQAASQGKVVLSWSAPDSRKPKNSSEKCSKDAE